MKIQYLAVIFIIIIMPIIIVFSEYMNTQINMVKIEQSYDEKLFNSTQDAINAFQINTINSMYYTPQSRVQNIEASVKTFFNSLVTSFNYDGNLASAMKSYIPAVAFTMYDGYYVYSPFKNTLTNVKTEVDEEYENEKIIEGLKPFVSYSCRYKMGSDNKEYIITYSMDNYIFVDIFDRSTKKHESKSGYLINGITEVEKDKKYIYDGVTFQNNIKETLNEYIGNKLYYYTVINGTKYYYKGNNVNGERNASECDPSDYIFYINEQREEQKQIPMREGNEKEFDTYYNKIFKNNSAFLYYKDSFEFTKWVKSNLGDLKVSDIVNSENYAGHEEFVDVGNIFEGDIQYSNSNFNRHRKDVIRAVIETNLSTAITGFKNYSNANNTEFLMPKISETDWELLENNICIVAFLQGLKVGDKTYNSYSIIPNNFNKEYVDENDIYLLKNDATYARANDTSLSNSTLETKSANGYFPGLSKINFERRQDKDGNYYNPVRSHINDTHPPYLLSYTSLASSSQIENISKTDMYRYMKDKDIKEMYYIALARERYGSFKYTLNPDFTPETTDRIVQVNYDVNGTSQSVQYQISSDEGIVLPEVQENDGYIFLGWFDGNVNVGKGGQSYIPTDDEINLTAKWIKDTITIEYDANGGNGAPSSVNVKYGETFEVSSDIPTKDDLLFTGWSDPTGRIWQPNETEIISTNNNYGIQNDTLTLTAQWFEADYFIDSNGKYATTLSEAVRLADSNDTIKVMRDITDNSDVNIDKNITINLNGKTLTRSNSTIKISSGKTTIKGNGKIDSDSVCIIRYNSTASLNVENVQLITDAHVIERESNGKGTLKINNSSIISRYANTLHLEGRGDVNIDNSTIVAEAKNSNAIGTTNNGAYNIKISGNSIVACALKNTALPGEWENAKGSAVYLANGGKLIVQGNACIIAGPYTDNAITVQNSSSVELVGSSSVYAYTNSCILCDSADTILIETNRCLYAQNFVVFAKNCKSFKYVRAQMASVNQKYMTKIGGTESNNTLRKTNVVFKKISGYNSRGKANLINENRLCYYLVKE